MAAQAEEQQSGGSFILEHIIDHHELHLGPLHIPLPHIESFWHRYVHYRPPGHDVGRLSITHSSP